MIENDLVDTADVSLVSESSVAQDHQYMDCQRQTLTSTVQQLDRLQTKPLTNLKAQTFFCLSQENDFDDDLSDDVLSHQVDHCQASISGEHYSEVSCDGRRKEIFSTSKSTPVLETCLQWMKPGCVTSGNSTIISSRRQNSDCSNTCRTSLLISTVNAAPDDAMFLSTSCSSITEKGFCHSIFQLLFTQR